MTHAKIDGSASSRRKALEAASARGRRRGALAGTAARVAQPAVRRKVKLTYWNWADNPTHQKISLDSVDMFNKSQNFIEVEVDATMAVMESRKKLVVAFAAGARARRHHDGAVLGAGLLRQRHPPSDRRLLQQVGREVGLLPERGRADALASRASRCCTCRRPASPTSCSIAPTG